MKNENCKTCPNKALCPLYKRGVRFEEGRKIKDPVRRKSLGPGIMNFFQMLTEILSHNDARRNKNIINVEDMKIYRED